MGGGDPFITNLDCSQCLISILLTGTPFALQRGGKGEFISWKFDVGLLAADCKGFDESIFPIWILLKGGHYLTLFYKDRKAKGMRKGEIMGGIVYDQFGGGVKSLIIHAFPCYEIISCSKNEDEESILRAIQTRWPSSNITITTFIQHTSLIPN